MLNPQRSEIWLVDLNPTRGQEMQKVRPVVVMSSGLFKSVALRIVIPQFYSTNWSHRIGCNERVTSRLSNLSRIRNTVILS
jgi:mRNA-degrading endonuclease toxin of MazEF toxin-antitoxin module